MAKQLARDVMRKLGSYNGITVLKTTVVVEMKCRAKDYGSLVRFDLKQTKSSCKLTTFVSHDTSFICLNPETGKNTSSTYCSSPCTPKQVYRLLYENISKNPRIPTKEIAGIVLGKGIFAKQP